MGGGGVVHGWRRGRRERYIPLSNCLYKARQQERGQMLPLPLFVYFWYNFHADPHSGDIYSIIIITISLFIFVHSGLYWLKILRKQMVGHQHSSVSICNRNRGEDVTAWGLHDQIRSAEQDWKGRTCSRVCMWCHYFIKAHSDRAKPPRDKKPASFLSAVVSSLTLNYANQWSSHSSLQTAPFLAPPQTPTPHLLFLLNTFILAPTIWGSCLLFIAIDSTAAFLCNELCKADKVRWHRHMEKYFLFVCAPCACLHVLISAPLAECVCECWITLSCHPNLHEQTSSRPHTFFCERLNTLRHQLPVSVETIIIFILF